MSALDHALIEELLSARALGGLDTDDEQTLARELAAHGVDCAECRRIQDECDEVAGRLAFALDPVAVPEGFEDRVARRAIGRRGESRRPPAVVRGWARGLVAVAASVALLSGGWVLRGAVGPGVPDPAAFIRAAKVVNFQGSGGTLAIAYRPGESGAYLFGAGLATPQPGRTYELWRFQEDTPISTGCFQPEAGGTLIRFFDTSLGEANQMAVTVESTSCPSAPTTTPILTADLTTA